MPLCVRVIGNACTRKSTSHEYREFDTTTKGQAKCFTSCVGYCRFCTRYGLNHGVLCLSELNDVTTRKTNPVSIKQSQVLSLHWWAEKLPWRAQLQLKKWSPNITTISSECWIKKNSKMKNNCERWGWLGIQLCGVGVWGRERWCWHCHIPWSAYTWQLIKQNRDEEDHHRDIGIQNDARKVWEYCCCCKQFFWKRRRRKSSW